MIIDLQMHCYFCFVFWRDNISAKGQCGNAQEVHWASMVSHCEGKWMVLTQTQGKWSFHSEFADIWMVGSSVSLRLCMCLYLVLAVCPVLHLLFASTELFGAVLHCVAVWVALVIYRRVLRCTIWTCPELGCFPQNCRGWASYFLGVPWCQDNYL